MFLLRKGSCCNGLYSSASKSTECQDLAPPQGLWKQLCVAEPCGHNYCMELVVGNSATLRGEFFLQSSHPTRPSCLAGSEVVRQKAEGMATISLINMRLAANGLRIRLPATIIIWPFSSEIAVLLVSVRSSKRRRNDGRLMKMTVRVISGRLIGEHIGLISFAEAVVYSWSCKSLSSLNLYDWRVVSFE